MRFARIFFIALAILAGNPEGVYPWDLQSAGGGTNGHPQ